MKPAQVERLIFANAVVKSESEMRQCEQDYATVQWPKAKEVKKEPEVFQGSTCATPSVGRLGQVD